MAESLLRLSSTDNVAVALRKIAAGDELRLGALNLRALDEVPMAHKIAICPIAVGEKVLKFGVPIGTATMAIPRGALVHVHNIRSDFVNNAIDHAEE